jgi:5'-phosphate synthase pdxT subunit
VEALPVRLPGELNSLDGLIIPGGESTTILKLMQSFDFFPPLRELAHGSFPIWGICAGMICLAKDISNFDMETLAVMEVKVKRNAFGRQIDSFETELTVPALGVRSFLAVFIRAPVISQAGPEVEILARLPDGTGVAARQGKMLISAFHPELGRDLRFHRYFLNIAAC